MDAPEWLEPAGFVCCAPARRGEDLGGCESADHPKLPVRSRVAYVLNRLFGSGSAGLGFRAATECARSKPASCDERIDGAGDPLLAWIRFLIGDVPWPRSSNTPPGRYGTHRPIRRPSKSPVLRPSSIYRVRWLMPITAMRRIPATSRLRPERRCRPSRHKWRPAAARWRTL